jgi:hypothetical protein
LVNGSCCAAAEQEQHGVQQQQQLVPAADSPWKRLTDATFSTPWKFAMTSER